MELEGAAMNSISTSSASTWQHKVRIFNERAQIFYNWLRSFFYIITLKIMHAGKALFAAIRRIEVDLLKETLDICYNSFTWLLGIIFTLKITDTGKAFFAANLFVMMAIVLIKFLSFLTMVLGTMSQMHTKNLFPLIFMLLFESAVSLLALSLISRTIMWIALILWLCIFVFFGYYCYPELKEMILQIKRWIVNNNPEGPSLPTVTESTIVQE